MLQNFYSFPFYGLLSGIILFTLYRLITRTYSRILIQRLGFLAPQIPTYLPYGIDLAYFSLKCTGKARDLQFWDWLFQYSPNKHSKTVEADVGGVRFVFTADPENIKAVLAQQFQDYGKGEPFHEDWKEFLGDSIFTTDGDLWHASRQLLRPQFVKERVRDLDIFEHHLQKVIGRLGGNGEVVDAADLFYRYTLDSATDFLLGQPVGSLDTPRVDFAEAFAEVQRVQNLVARLGPLHHFLPKGSFRKGLKVIDQFVEQFIEAVLAIEVNELQEIKNKSFLQALAASGIRDRKVIRDQMIAILLAGRDTTAGALSFTFLELSRHPEKFDKLRREVLDVVGPYEKPTYEKLKNMPYLQHTINEVLRLYPGVPFNVRLALHDTTLPTGGGPDGRQPLGLLKDTPVGYSTIYMQRREDLYPSDPKYPHPHEFCPERWDTWQPKPWHYIPFNGGPRICIGQQFALTEMGYTISRILQRFDRLDCHSSPVGPQFRCEIVISPYDGVKLGFWNAKEYQ